MIINYSHHDAFFKRFLSDLNVARDFFKNYLPASLRRICQFNTLTLCSGSFVEPDLRNHCSDILYSVRTRQGKGYIYCLVEHQSSPQKLMAFRLMRYSLAAMQQHLDKGHKRLPVVVPLLFYHGLRKGYPYSNDWLGCFDDHAMAREVYNRPFPVIDITQTPDENIMTHGRVAIMELMAKHIRIRDMAALIKDAAVLLNRWPLPPELNKCLFAYMVRAGKTNDGERLMLELAERVPRFLEDNDMMSIAQYLEQKGEKVGIERGMEKGMEKGVEKGKRQVARQLLLRGVEYALIKEATGLSDDELACLGH